MRSVNVVYRTAAYFQRESGTFCNFSLFFRNKLELLSEFEFGTACFSFSPSRYAVATVTKIKFPKVYTSL